MFTEIQKIMLPNLVLNVKSSSVVDQVPEVRREVVHVGRSRETNSGAGRSSWACFPDQSFRRIFSSRDFDIFCCIGVFDYEDLQVVLSALVVNQKRYEVDISYAYVHECNDSND